MNEKSMTEVYNYTYNSELNNHNFLHYRARLTACLHARTPLKSRQHTRKHNVVTGSKLSHFWQYSLGSMTSS